jgi:hypothetical protein
MHAHYANIRYLGLNGRVKGTNQAPLRILGDSLAVKVKGFIMPVIAIEDGHAIVDASAKAETAIAQTPKTPTGSWDYAALDELAPVIAEPWDLPELKGLTFVGTRADATRSRSGERHPKAKPEGLRLSAKPAVTKTATPKARTAAPAEPKAHVDADMAIAYLASLSGEGMAALIAKLNAAKAEGSKRTKRTSVKVAKR